ncbi:MAG: formate dehydrogenase accessory protein FdhE, partial [Chloroflexota bacterium]
MKPKQPPLSDPQLAVFMRRLNAVAEQNLELVEAISFYRETLPLLREAQKNVESFTLNDETIQNKINSGVPLLIGEDLPLNVEATRELFLKLCVVVEKVGASADDQKKKGFSLFSRGKPDAAKMMDQVSTGNDGATRSAAAQQIRHAVEKDQLDLVQVWGALASGTWSNLQSLISDLQLDPDLLRVLAQYSLRPSFRAWAEGLHADFDKWQRGLCPMCGNAPSFAEIQGKEGARRLRCSMCGADWAYPRLQCVFCANDNFKSLGYIVVEGEEEKYNLQTCDECHGYIKTIATFDPTPVDLILIEDLATLHLDVSANEKD